MYAVSHMKQQYDNDVEIVVNAIICTNYDEPILRQKYDRIWSCPIKHIYQFYVDRDLKTVKMWDGSEQVGYLVSFYKDMFSNDRMRLVILPKDMQRLCQIRHIKLVDGVV